LPKCSESTTIAVMPKDVQTGAVDLSGEQIHWKPSGGLSYGSYLNLEPLLGAQKPLTEVPDEMLFISISDIATCGKPPSC